MVKYGTLDFLIVLVSYLATMSATTVIDIRASLDDGLWFIVLSGVVTLMMLYLCGVYHRIWSRTSGHGITVIINAVGAAAGILVVASILINPRPLPLTIVILAQMVALVGFTVLRYRSRLVSGANWRWKAIWLRQFPKVNYTRTLIVGAGEAGQTLAWRLKHRFTNSEYRIVGFVDDDPEKHGMYVEGCRVLGGRKDIARLTEAYNIDLIVMSIHNISGPDFREILTICEKTKARIKVVPDVFALMNATHSNTLLRDVQPEDLIGRSVVTRHEAVDMTPVTLKTVLVTGAAGSIGSELSRQLCGYDPVKLILLDANESGLHDLVVELQANYPHLKLMPVLGDITQRDMMRDVYNDYRPQVVFHAAAYKHVPMLERYPDQAVRVNVGGTRNLAELAQEFGVERFVLISTDKAVNPSSVMGASKRLCELMLHRLSQQVDNKTLFTAVRFGNVLGSRGSVVPTFNSQISKGGPVTITHPEMTRYFMSIAEAVNLVIHAACMTKGGEVYLLKMGETVKIVDLAERMIRLRGMRPYKDIEIRFTGIRPGEKLHEELHDGTEEVLDTIHPGIIQLRSYTKTEIEWHDVDTLLADGLDRKGDALTQLLWGIPPKGNNPPSPPSAQTKSSNEG
jgi:FlaA1/EpsC-like NDP-sugar epimerase